MNHFIIEIDDDKRGRDRKIYLTSWGSSAWRIHANEYEKPEAEKRLSDFLKENKDMTGGRLIQL